MLKKFSCFLIVLIHGCQGAGQRSDSDMTLPFTIRLKNIAPPELVDPAQAKIPANFGDPDNLSRLRDELADAIDESKLFSSVVTDEKDVPVDLELTISLSGSDFGKGNPTWIGATFSTMAWLFAGHASWYIDNRIYPNSQVNMIIEILPPPGDPNTKRKALFNPSLPIKGLTLNFSERMNLTQSALNILLPPWWGEGDREKAGINLANRTPEFFKKNGPQQIRSTFPNLYFNQLSCYLDFDLEEKQIVIFSKENLKTIALKPDGSKEALFFDEIKTQNLLAESSVDEDLWKKLSPRSQLTTKPEHFYSLMASDFFSKHHDTEYFQIEVTIEGQSRPRTFTIYRPVEATEIAAR